MLFRNAKKRGSCLLKLLVALFTVALIFIGIAAAIVIFLPDVAAQNIDHLRDVIGDAPVAQLEETVLGAKDRAEQLGYNAGLVKPVAPWAVSEPTSAQVVPTETPTIEIAATSVVLNDRPTTASPAATSQANTPTSTATADKSLWQPAALKPLGNIAGEGQWSPYLYTAKGIPVAYRTFLLADPQRPYSVAAIVAFDLSATRLHFVLGTVEPIPVSPQPSRTGTIALADLRPGILLATFNGGFKARHGDYGAMADGLVALPPIKGLATVAIYANGLVQIGRWGIDIQESPALLSWRQNGEMLVNDGAINPATANTAVSWGRTITGGTITWRSALGISMDERILYYVAGPHLDAPTIARAMIESGAWQALELDVNDYWVNFEAIRSHGSTLVAEPLFEAMNIQTDRYLKGWSRDFFYVTSARP